MPTPTISDANPLQPELARLEMNSHSPAANRTKSHTADTLLGKESKLDKIETKKKDYS